MSYRKETKFKKTKIGLIPEDWELKKIEEVCDIKGRIGWRGYTLKDLTYNGPLVLGAENITQANSLSLSKPVYISKFKYYESPEIKINKNDIIIVKVGSTVGRIAIIDEEIGDATINPNLLLIKNITINNYFLYFYLISEYPKNFIISGGIASAQPAINQTTFKKLLVPIPKKLEQENISGILYNIYKKIKINIQINKTIEKIAQKIFKHWFVDYEFPNEQGKPYKSSRGEFKDSELGKIPKDWEISSFNSMSNLTMGVSPKGSTYNNKGIGLPLINGAADFKGNIISPNKYSSIPIRICNIGDIIFCIRATIGNITFADKEYCLGRGVASLKPNREIYKYLLYFNLLFSLNKIIKKASGSVIIGLSKEDIGNIKFVNPSEKILKNFHFMIGSIFSSIEIFKKQNDRLSEIRDTLLPKLITGKIRLM